MKKKRIIAGAAGIMMLGAMVLPVYAGGEDETGDSQMQVTYDQPSTWEVSIPATPLSQTEEVEQSVSAGEVNIRPEQKLQVKITGISDGKVTLTRDTDDGVTTEVTVSTTTGGKNPIDGDTVIAEFEDQSTDLVNGTKGKLYFSAVPEDAKAGYYTGTITYVMQAVNKVQ